MEMQTQRTDLWTQCGRKKVGQIETVTWKQPRCSSRDEQIKKLWYIYTMEYYSAIKRNVLVLAHMTWTNLEPII